MLAKIIHNKKKKSSFNGLINYITTRDENYLEHIHEYELENVSNQAIQLENYQPTNEFDELLNINEKIISKTGVSCQHNCLSLETAAREMQAVAVNNSRVENPVYHFLISWRSEDNPSDDEMFECAKYALKKLGMEQHQFVLAIHRDTDNSHVHVCTNRIHPETFKAQSISHDYFKLDKAMRELELKYGWLTDNGPFSIQEQDGNKVIDWNNQSRNEHKKPDIANYMELYSGSDSFYNYIQGQPKQDIQILLKSKNLTWNILHTKLAEYGIKIAPKGQGLALYNDDMSLAIKASSISQNLSKGKLEKRLGEYKPFTSSKGQNYKKTSYDKFNFSETFSKRDPLLRNKRKEERAAARKKLLEEYASYKKNFVFKRITKQDVLRQLKSISLEAKDLRLMIRNRVPGNSQDQINMRRAFYSVIAFETARKKEQLFNEISKKRRELAQDPDNQRLSYKRWVTKEAENGNQAAISQLRGFHYAEQKAIKRKNGFLSTSEEVKDDANDQILTKFKKDILKTGITQFNLINSDISFVDIGNHISLNIKSSKSEDAVLAALLRAKEKFLDKFELTGTEEFKERVFRLLISNKIKVDLTNKSQKYMYEKLLKDQQMANIKQKNVHNKPS